MLSGLPSWKRMEAIEGFSTWKWPSPISKFLDTNALVWFCFILFFFPPACTLALLQGFPETPPPSASPQDLHGKLTAFI